MPTQVFNMADAITKKRQAVKDTDMDNEIGSRTLKDNAKFQVAKWQKYISASHNDDSLLKLLGKNSDGSPLDLMRGKAKDAIKTVHAYVQNELLIKQLEELRVNAASDTQLKLLNRQIDAAKKAKRKCAIQMDKNNKVLNKERNFLVSEYVKATNQSPADRALATINYVREMLESATYRDAETPNKRQDERSELQKVKSVLARLEEYQNKILAEKSLPDAGIIAAELRSILSDYESLQKGPEYGYIIKNGLQILNSFERVMDQQVKRNDRQLKFLKKFMEKPVAKGNRIDATTWEFRQMTKVAGTAQRMQQLLQERKALMYKPAEIDVLGNAIKAYDVILEDFRNLEKLTVQGQPLNIDRGQYLQKLDDLLVRIGRAQKEMEGNPVFSEYKGYFDGIKALIVPLQKSLSKEPANKAIVMSKNYKEILPNPITVYRTGNNKQAMGTNNKYNEKIHNIDLVRARYLKRYINGDMEILDMKNYSSIPGVNENRQKLREAILALYDKDIKLLGAAVGNKFMNEADFNEHKKLSDILNEVRVSFIQAEEVTNPAAKKGIAGAFKEFFGFQPPTREISEKGVRSNLAHQLRRFNDVPECKQILDIIQGRNLETTYQQVPVAPQASVAVERASSARPITPPQPQAAATGVQRADSTTSIKMEPPSSPLTLPPKLSPSYEQNPQAQQPAAQSTNTAAPQQPPNVAPAQTRSSLLGNSSFFNRQKLPQEPTPAFLIPLEQAINLANNLIVRQNNPEEAKEALFKAFALRAEILKSNPPPLSPPLQKLSDKYDELDSKLRRPKPGGGQGPTG